MDADLRSRILASKDAKGAVTLVAVPEWNETVGLRRLSLRERLGFEKDNGAMQAIDAKTDPETYVRWMVRYVILGAVTPEGERLFHPDDEEALASKSASSIERLAIAAMRINTVTAEDIATLGKSSGEVLNGASPSGSPVTSG